MSCTFCPKTDSGLCWTCDEVKRREAKYADRVAQLDELGYSAECAAQFSKQTKTFLKAMKNDGSLPKV